MLDIWGFTRLGGCLLLVERVDRFEELGRGGRVLPDLRRAQSPALRGGDGVAAADYADMRDPPDAQYLQIRI